MSTPGSIGMDSTLAVEMWLSDGRRLRLLLAGKPPAERGNDARGGGVMPAAWQQLRLDRAARAGLGADGRGGPALRPPRAGGRGRRPRTPAAEGRAIRRLLLHRLQGRALRR